MNPKNRQLNGQRDAAILRRLGAAIERSADNVVRVRFIGRQRGEGLCPDVDLYNTLEESAAGPAEDTVTLDGLRRLGLSPWIVGEEVAG